MPNEYYAVILQFTSRNLKLGFAGDLSPQVEITPDSPIWKRFRPNAISNRQYPAFLSTESHALEPSIKTELKYAIDMRPDLKDMVDQYNDDIVRSKWTEWKTHEFHELSRLVKHYISTELLVSPLRCKLFVVDPGYLAVTKYQLCLSILGQKTAITVSFLPMAPLAAISAYVEDAIVVNIEWNECSVSAVSDLRVILDADYAQYSLESLHYNIVSEGIARDFKEVETLIQSHNVANTSIVEMLPALIARTIINLDIDTRPKVVQNVIFLGYKGFNDAIVTGLQKQLPTLKAAGTRCLGAWAGASLYCSTTLPRQPLATWKHSEITRDKLDTKAWQEFQDQAAMG